MTKAEASAALSNAAPSSFMVSNEMALRACGRFTVTTANPSSISRSTIKHSPDSILAFSQGENSITKMRTIPVDLTKRYVEQGWWRPETLGQMVADGLAASPDAGFYVHSETRPYAGTFAEVELQARRLAAGLQERGVGPGDVVALQLPNWMEAAVAFWASALLGAVTVPIVHFYGRKELGHIIATVQPKVFLTLPPGRSSPSPPGPPRNPRVSCTVTRRSASRPASCWTTTHPTGADSSPRHRSATSSA
jgi:non-ribosomal peptide synthetase component F